MKPKPKQRKKKVKAVKAWACLSLKGEIDPWFIFATPKTAAFNALLNNMKTEIVPVEIRVLEKED